MHEQYEFKLTALSRNTKTFQAQGMCSCRLVFLLQMYLYREAHLFSRNDPNQSIVTCKIFRYLVSNLNTLICIRIFILKLQARHPEKLPWYSYKNNPRFKKSFRKKVRLRKSYMQGKAAARISIYRIYRWVPPCIWSFGEFWRSKGAR